MTREPPLPLDWDCAACAALQAEVGRLMARIDEHHRIFEPMRAEIERLRAALQRIDGINDNPACYNPMIEEVLRAALEPKPAIAPCDDAEFGMTP